MNIDWKPVGEDSPEEDEPCLLYNGVRVIATKFKRGLVHPDAPFPVTHYAPLELPYKPKAPDLTCMEAEAGRQRIRKGQYLTCTVSGCDRGHHAKGLCLRHYMLRRG